jgi:hypothetical protein
MPAAQVVRGYQGALVAAVAEVDPQGLDQTALWEVMRAPELEVQLARLEQVAALLVEQVEIIRRQVTQVVFLVAAGVDREMVLPVQGAEIPV